MLQILVVQLGSNPQRRRLPLKWKIKEKTPSHTISILTKLQIKYCFHQKTIFKLRQLRQLRQSSSHNFSKKKLWLQPLYLLDWTFNFFLWKVIIDWIRWSSTQDLFRIRNDEQLYPGLDLGCLLFLGRPNWFSEPSQSTWKFWPNFVRRRQNKKKNRPKNAF